MVTGSRRCAVRCNAVIKAASSSSCTYWSSSTKSARQLLPALAASPTASNRSCKSVSKSPLSASPGSGSKSNPTSMSSYFTLSALANPANPRRARCASILAALRFESFSKARRSCGAKMEGRRTIFRRFDPQCVGAVRLGTLANAVEQYGFPHAPQANHEHTLARAPDLGTLQGNSRGLADLVAAGQLRRLGARSRRVGVADGVHTISL